LLLQASLRAERLGEICLIVMNSLPDITFRPLSEATLHLKTLGETEACES